MTAKTEEQQSVGIKAKEVTIPAPNMRTAEFVIRGTAPYVQHKFSSRIQQKIKETQEKGSQAKKGAKREPKDFQQAYLDAQHISDDDWNGIPAPAFRNACISSCRVVGFQMTKAKLSIFVEADGYDRDDGTPLVRITKGKPIRFDMAVRNESGVIDIRARPKWDPGWEAKVRVRFDGDQFSDADVANLMMRAGLQVGIGEGRPDSRESAGMGWGTFEVVS